MNREITPDDVIMVTKSILFRAKALYMAGNSERALALLEKNVVLSSVHPTKICMRNLDRTISNRAARTHAVPRRETKKHWKWKEPV